MQSVYKTRSSTQLSSATASLHVHSCIHPYWLDANTSTNLGASSTTFWFLRWMEHSLSFNHRALPCLSASTCKTKLFSTHLFGEQNCRKRNRSFSLWRTPTMSMVCLHPVVVENYFLLCRLELDDILGF